MSAVLCKHVSDDDVLGATKAISGRSRRPTAPATASLTAPDRCPSAAGRSDARGLAQGHKAPAPSGAHYAPVRAATRARVHACWGTRRGDGCGAKPVPSCDRHHLNPKLVFISTHPPRLNNPNYPSDPSALPAVRRQWAMDSLVKDWALFLNRCLEGRVAADLFAAAASQLHTQSPLPGRKLAALLLKPRAATATTPDPRVVVYAERLLELRKIDAADLLSSTFQFSKDRPPKAGEEAGAGTRDPPPWQNPAELEEIVFHRLHKAFAGEHPDRPVTNAEGVRTLAVVTAWMTAMVTSHTSDSMIQAMTGIQQHPQQQSINVREALGMLVLGLLENGRILQLLSKDELKGGSSPRPDTRSKPRPIPLVYGS